MELHKEVINLMGKKVEYCRIKPKEDGTADLHRGAGIIVGVIVGISRRVQVMVKDDAEEKNQAFTLDSMCINPSEDDAHIYLEHHKKVKAIVDEHNAAQKGREQEKIKEVDDINAQMFGAPLDI